MTVFPWPVRSGWGRRRRRRGSRRCRCWQVLADRSSCRSFGIGGPETGPVGGASVPKLPVPAEP